MTTRWSTLLRLFLLLLLFLTLGTPPDGPVRAVDLRDDGYHVFAGDNIQDAVELAAANRTNKTVRVHAGQYRPKAKRQALIWLNRKHDGVRLEALGPVTLTAANPEISNPRTPGYPAVVNHVVYFGDGITSNTSLSGFRITGANHFVSDKLTSQIEPDTSLAKNLFFYTDGGAIKIFGRSYPVIRNLEVVGNYASPCGAGISVQHEGFSQSAVWIDSCRFLSNRAQVTGAAIDLLAGSAAIIRNCLFVGNESNIGEDVVAKKSGEKPFTNSGVITIFPGSRAEVRYCTFTGNRNAIDDMGGASLYSDCIFSGNTLAGGLPSDERYELDLPAGATVIRCVLSGNVRDPRRSISGGDNILDAPLLTFTPEWVPVWAAKTGPPPAGYRPSSTPAAAR